MEHVSIQRQPRMLTAALFKLAPNWKRPKCPKCELTENINILAPQRNTQHQQALRRNKLPTAQHPCTSDTSRRERSQTKSGNSSRLRSHRPLWKASSDSKWKAASWWGQGRGRCSLTAKRHAELRMAVKFCLGCYRENACVKPVQLHTVWLHGL